jgi:hypothetical protein
MTLREAAQKALEALEALQGGCTDSNDGTVEAITVWCPEVIEALKDALAQPEQPKQDKHITDGSLCWCGPELVYVDPENGAKVWVHKEPT